jgi:hypothetical protein
MSSILIYFQSIVQSEASDSQLATRNSHLATRISQVAARKSQNSRLPIWYMFVLINYIDVLRGYGILNH